MKKRVLVLTTALLLAAGRPTSAASNINLSNSASGIVSFDYQSNKPLAALIEKDGVKTQHILAPDNTAIPFQMGDGDYTIYLLEYKNGKSYSVVEKATAKVKLEKEKMYLSSTSEVNFNNTPSVTAKAKELTQHLDSSELKVQAIYKYIVSMVKYDYSKAKEIPSNYIPNLEDTYNTNKGICYDYSSLGATMLRSIGVQTKLVKGYKLDMGDIYHAWNEVFVDGEWKIIDMTYDSIRENNSMYKPKSEYKETSSQ